MSKIYKLSDVCDIKIGRTPPRVEKEWFNQQGKSYKWVSIKDIGNCKKYLYDTNETLTVEAQQKFNIPIVPKDTIILSFKLTIGRIAITTEDMLTNEAIAQIVIKDETIVSKEYLYYYLKYYDYKSLGNTSSIGKSINSEIIKSMPIQIPSIEEQERITRVFKTIDDKIITNNQIINLYDKLLVHKYKLTFTLNDAVVKKATEIANINIGKTPPRTEKECFSCGKDGIKWISISDIGNSGMYVFETNEKIRNFAVEKYNVKVVPKNTIILSFKLTIGKVAITTEDMLTNEAIAHFNLYDESLLYYLYYYLKQFDYKSLGNTSSIGKAVNSKIIKEMDITIPTKRQIDNFNTYASLIFRSIKVLEQENINLEKLLEAASLKLFN